MKAVAFAKTLRKDLEADSDHIINCCRISEAVAALKVKSTFYYLQNKIKLTRDITKKPNRSKNFLPNDDEDLHYYSVINLRAYSNNTISTKL